MNILAILIPVSLTLGGLGLLAFLWSLRSDQYDDLDGAAWRILLDDETPPVDVDQRPETDHPAGS
ncbi:cbb3-type cytochrome oxidase assembly protein CcoS [Sulfitobacter geojensis]|jgi:cbb3-type cytochrome oxidase maturation protein|uniref:Cbb3-type cytochrome oxidase assembly protein CcoS n=1 Tax=Sulfitobacter geojensis TaxID=1342299 RepID=A0AAE2VWG6_9RHOB|nr:cbb3-type cytochrome oxidase assembly protein CcoS [Sulfitobacter geojensis]MBM1688695.1 cbb3-type cytochrome oxidase assembly protein CcoS [Sulfitobacter geojensis]MBM1692762.1 cbb3-type cytochrome oxidase assembly protein CcoS [Sulfitobacter geojensis]MBM1704928.1 cbb3-type cytochrome oxidase assembly protein CcoS [Sulfitobacter geojensis]MBM1708986.1 cbb3-type cytochrome oxidase assembly protein CcoS [Sulfitobacter geojensis]MBM1713051.1 cbb3-type cytochrome oxidase assembly protein CcoS